MRASQDGTPRYGARTQAVSAALALFAAACTDSVPTRISESGYAAYEVSLAVSGDMIAVGWYDTRDGNAELYLRRLDAAGRRKGAEERLTSDPAQSYEIDLAAVGERLAVAWYDEDAAGRVGARLGLLEPGAGFVWQLDLSARGRPSRNPVVRAVPDRIFCAWIETDDAGTEHVVAGSWRADGQPAESRVVLGQAGPSTWNLNAALDGAGRAHVVFDSDVATRAAEIYLATLDGGVPALTRLTADDGAPSKYPDLALDGDRMALAWFDERDGNREVYLHAGTLAELDAPLDARARRVTHTAHDSIGAYVAWNGARIGLAWSDQDSGASHNIRFQAFDAASRPLGPIALVTQTPQRSLIPAIRAWRNGFVIAWNEVTPGPAGMHDPATTSEVELVVVP